MAQSLPEWIRAKKVRCSKPKKVEIDHNLDSLEDSINFDDVFDEVAALEAVQDLVQDFVVGNVAERVGAAGQGFLGPV